MAKHPRKKQKVVEQVQPLGETREVDDDAEKDDEERRLESLLFGKPFVPRTGAKGKGKDILVVADEEDEEDGIELEFAGGKELDGLRDADVSNALSYACITLNALFSSYFSLMMHNPTHHPKFLILPSMPIHLH